MSQRYELVAAIDIGTTYTGYAFSTRSDFDEDPLKITTNQAWVAGHKYHLSLKTPTTLLLDKAGKFIAFGYDAELQYNDIVLDGTE